MQNKLFILLTSTMLVSCTMAPRYDRPVLPVADEWTAGKPEEIKIEPVTLDKPAEKAQEKVEEKEIKIPASEIRWQDFFRSKGLQTVIQTALDNNRDLKIAALNIESARALYGIERANLLPSVEATASATRQRTPDELSVNGQAETTSIYRANLASTAYELDLFGRVRSLSNAALEQYLATEEAAKSIEISLIGETANAYLQLLADRKILKLSEQTLEAQNHSYELISKSNEAGVASALDLARVKTSVETAKVNLAVYTRIVEQDENALMVLLGVRDKSIIPADENLEDISLMAELPVGLPSEVLLARPDIKQAEHLLKSRNADIGAARAAFFPTISLTGSFGYASGSLSDLFKSGAAGAWSFVPQATLPIFEGGRNIANLDNANAQQKIAIAEYEKAIQNAFREVADELAARKTLGDQTSAQTELVKATQTAYNISNARYKSGIDNYLSVLDAQRSKFSSQQDLINVERLKLSNLVNLYKTLGGGSNVIESE